MYLFILSIILFFSIDLFITGIALGINNIKFKLSNILFITITISLTIICSYLFRHIIISNINRDLFKLLIFILLIILGLIKIKNYFIKKDINNILINELNIKELLILVTSLAIDNMLVSISLNISIYYFILLVILQFITSCLVLFLSNYFSYKFSKFNKNIGELISGILFILIAIYNIF